MKNQRIDIKTVIIIVFACLIALALLYLNFLKLKFLFH
jgi:hypothetical protein